MFASRSSRLEKSSPSMCCDAASVAKRGSRLVGFDSRRNVSALGLALAFEEQPQATEAITKRSNEAKRRLSLRNARWLWQLARRRIRNLTENCRAAGARRGRKIRRATMKCFVGHQCEGEGFFRGGRNAESVGRDDLNGRGRKTFETA